MITGSRTPANSDRGSGDQCAHDEKQTVVHETQSEGCGQKRKRGEDCLLYAEACREERRKRPKNAEAQDGQHRQYSGPETADPETP